ncbi:phosphotransferase [Mesomycoplasma molare]|uniref:Phosphotransferase n=1 Tax=Mesomycoplasma molare TaxID=171288 RepID=A0ABY5TUT0_9BACT|nr:phosphotransferase [Mesomycoplasma molare]UWD34415.1 phosphotransferase [Mesomycoplasma molare]
MKFDVFPEEIRKKIRNCKFFYIGKQNKTYLCEFEKELVQVRIKNNNFVNYENESQFVSYQKEFLYYDKGNYIKKWFSGKEISKVFLTKKIKLSILKKLNEFSKLNSKNIETFNWNQLEIKDKKFNKIIYKYKNMPLVLSHGDLRPKNVLLSKNKEIKLIDFEWVRKNYLLFDLAHLYLYFRIEKKLITKFFLIQNKELNDFIYLVKKFNLEWEKKYYKD